MDSTLSKRTAISSMVIVLIVTVSFPWGANGAVDKQPGWSEVELGMELASPRALGVDGEGNLYIADAGDPGIANSGKVVEWKQTSSESAVVFEGISNFVAEDKGFGIDHIHGASDIAVNQSGDIYLVVGQESWVENPLRGPSQLIKIGKLGDVESIFDFNYYEGLHNPDGKAVESNANGVALSPDQSIWITDAGGNWIAHLARDGSVISSAAFPQVDGQDAVPTGITTDRDGNAYVALFRCQTPTEGRGGIAKITRDGKLETIFDELSNPIDITFGSDGSAYVLEFSVDYAPMSGRVTRINPNGTRDVIMNGLNNPTSLAIIGSQIYVSQMSSPAGGTLGTGGVVVSDLPEN